METTYTVVITSEGLDENYVYTFKLASGATLDQNIRIREGYTYALYVGDTEVEDITVECDVNYTVKYTAEEEEPITPPDDSSSESVDDGEDSSEDSSEDSASDSQSGSDEAEGGCGGCSSVVSAGGVGVTFLLASTAMLLKKKKED